MYIKGNLNKIRQPMYFNKVQKCASQCMFSFFSNEKGLCRRVTMNLKDVL